MSLRPFKHLLLERTTILIMMVMMMLKNVNSKPQDGAGFEKVASHAISVAGNMAEMVQNAGMISKNMAIDLPFVKANSETKAGTGAALRNNDDDDDSSEEDRRKRSIDFPVMENSLIGEETLPALPHDHHFHRGKRSPCHTSGGSTGTDGTAGDGTGGTDYTDDIDAARRRRGYMQKRIANAKKAKSQKTINKNRRKNFIKDNERKIQTLIRRKRQSEIDDLNENMQNESNAFVQQAQQIAEKIRNTFDNLMTSMNEMVQKIQKHFNQ